MGCPRGAKASDKAEGTLGEGLSVREVGGGLNSRGELVP